MSKDMASVFWVRIVDVHSETDFRAKPLSSTLVLGYMTESPPQTSSS